MFATEQGVRDRRYVIPAYYTGISIVISHVHSCVLFNKCITTQKTYSIDPG